MYCRLDNSRCGVGISTCSKDTKKVDGSQSVARRDCYFEPCGRFVSRDVLMLPLEPSIKTRSRNDTMTPRLYLCIAVLCVAYLHFRSIPQRSRLPSSTVEYASKTHNSTRAQIFRPLIGCVKKSGFGIHPQKCTSAVRCELGCQ